MTSAPYLAPSLAVLRAEINARWPNRDHASDGWIGDTRHQQTKSDHNPNGRGSVDALDVDEDGISFAVVFAAIKRHPSARYVIYERRLYHRLRGWKSEPYSGENPHDKHFHASIDQTREAEQDRRPWGLLEDDDMTKEQVRDALIEALGTPLPYGANGPAARLTGKGWAPRISVLGLLAYMMEHAVDGRPITELAAIRTDLAALAGREPVDEQALAAQLLTVLTPQAIAAALPVEVAREVADELAGRLAA